MRRTAWIMAAAFVSLAACGSVTSPHGGGGGGGPVGQVSVGNIYFKSAHNGSKNAAVDTIAAGGSVTWIWDAQGSHSIQSTGTPPGIFRNSVVMDAHNSTYTVTLNNPGTYPYQCAVHGAAMTGVIVVQ
jgi:plastocyanin